MTDATFAHVARRSDDELRAAIATAGSRERLLCAWALGARACTDDLAAAFGLVRLDPAIEPAALRRRVLPMALMVAKELGALAVLAEHDPVDGVRATASQFLARAANPDDAATYAVLSRIAKSDTNGDVRAAVASNIRPDAPEAVVHEMKSWMRDGSRDVVEAAIEAIFATSESPTAFLRRMKSESSERVAYALAFLRGKKIAIAWSDVSAGYDDRHLPVLVELAHHFARRTDAPIAFWLRCVKDAKALVTHPETTWTLVLDGATSAASRTRTGALTADDHELLDSALEILVDLLPAFAHPSYMELKVADVLADPFAQPRRPITTTFARVWLALLRLSPHPSLYVLRPRYR